jgi:nucleotide-binding universal stress UspA family protein
MMKILLAMDTSGASQTALEEILARPWPAGTSFEVISVVEPSHLWATSEVAQQSARCAEGVVQRAITRLKLTDQNATGFALPGDPKTVILDRARSAGADFIVVGSNDVSTLTRFLLGNVAATVLRYAPCSVEVVRARARGAQRGNMKVLLAADGSEYSLRAAHSIANRPWPTGTEVRVLSAVELILPTTRVFLEPPFFDSAFVETARAEAMQRAQDAIAQSRQILSASGLDVSESMSVLLETPKAIILDEAARWGADLIVLGSHGRHGVDRFLLGSVSEAVAMHATCSVEVFRKSL